MCTSIYGASHRPTTCKCRSGSNFQVEIRGHWLQNCELFKRWQRAVSSWCWLRWQFGGGDAKVQTLGADMTSPKKLHSSPVFHRFWVAKHNKKSRIPSWYMVLLRDSIFWVYSEQHFSYRRFDSCNAPVEMLWESGKYVHCISKEKKSSNPLQNAWVRNPTTANPSVS